MTSWWNSHIYNDIPHRTVVVAIFVSYLFVTIALQQLLNTRWKHSKKLRSRSLTFVFTIIAAYQNSIQVYSFYNDCNKIMILLRVSLGVIVYLGLFATYSFITSTVNSMYQIQNKANSPKWFIELWNIVLIINIIALLIFYGTAFAKHNGLFFDMYWICFAITVYIGTIATCVASCKIGYFLGNTANEFEEINKNALKQKFNINHSDNKLMKRLIRLKKMKYRLYFIGFFAVIVLIPVTVYLIIILNKLENPHDSDRNIMAQPFPSWFLYVGMVCYASIMEIQLLAWTFSSRKCCNKSDNDMMCYQIIFCFICCTKKYKDQQLEYKKSIDHINVEHVENIEDATAYDIDEEEQSDRLQI